MSKFTNRADLLIAAGESIKMQEKAGVVIPMAKLDGDKCSLEDKEFLVEPSRYEFPLAVVEGKPVFIGDELYNRNGVKFIAEKITKYGTGAITSNDEKVADTPNNCTWNPPKPKTVMVELLREDVKYWTSYDDSQVRYTGLPTAYTDASKRFYESCRKALESQ